MHFDHLSSCKIKQFLCSWISFQRGVMACFQCLMIFPDSIFYIMYAEGIRCVKNVTIHTAPILSINAGEHWLGIGAADNSMSLFHQPQERLGGFSSTGSKMSGWQLYRTPQRTVAMV